MHRSRRFGAEPVNVDENASPADPVRQPELAKFVDERKRVFLWVSTPTSSRPRRSGSNLWDTPRSPAACTTRRDSGAE